SPTVADGGLDAPPAEGTVLRMQAVGANPNARAVGRDVLPGYANYFIGNDPSRWHTDVPTYGRVEYQDVYPGIDLVYYGNKRQLEYDFVAPPGASPDTIALNFAGADQVAIDGGGDLVVSAGGQTLRQHRPVVFQEVNGTRQEVSGQFVLLSS